MRRPNGLDRPVLPRKALVGLFATVASLALALCGVALADTVTTNFEAPPFRSCGLPPAPPVLAPPQFMSCWTVNGQDGWKSAIPGNIPSLPAGYDQQVVANSGAPPEFGSQSLRISNAYGTGPTTSPPEFHFQTYSAPTTDAAGESETNKVYTAQFSFISVHPNQVQPRLLISLSPDNGEGGRMSYIGLEDINTTDSGCVQDEPCGNGIDVSLYDTPDGHFVGYDLGVLPRDVPHTIKFWMKLNPGPGNDLVRILIDGHDVGQCFTTWEDFYRATNQDVPISDRLLLLSGNRDGNRLSLLGGGYLFDNVTTTTAAPGPPGCDLPIEKTADSPTVIAGGLVGYRISVRNRGRLSERNVLVCDHIPREMTFVSADRKLRRLGRRRCLLIQRLGPGQRVSFHLVLRVDANAPPGTVDNIVDETPVAPPVTTTPPVITPPATPPGAQVPDVPGKVTGTPPVIKMVRAPVKVLARRKLAAPPPPHVTG